ncbi:MAG: hypothetical protein KKD17_00700 [Nanoarchaeota archaeon]|nr:hypothetical protein [Nanoarchaeota archaeon]
MTNRCETYILNRSGRWIREEDWFWPTVSEDESLDEEDDIKGELSLDERMSVAGPVSRALYAARNWLADDREEPSYRRPSYAPVVGQTDKAAQAYR